MGLIEMLVSAHTGAFDKFTKAVTQVGKKTFAFKTAPTGFLKMR